MKLIKANSLKDASLYSLEFLPEESKVDFSVAFTGGRFGEELIQSIANTNFRIGNWKILQTDERVSSKEEDLIQSKIIKGISKCNGFSEENLIFFPFGKNYLDELEAFERRLQQSKIDELDICFLSIGEDGHLAGHFHNSRGYKNSIFCFNIFEILLSYLFVKFNYR